MMNFTRLFCVSLVLLCVVGAFAQYDDYLWSWPGVDDDDEFEMFYVCHPVFQEKYDGIPIIENVAPAFMKMIGAVHTQTSFRSKNDPSIQFTLQYCSFDDDYSVLDVIFPQIIDDEIVWDPEADLLLSDFIDYDPTKSSDRWVDFIKISDNVSGAALNDIGENYWPTWNATHTYYQAFMASDYFQNDLIMDSNTCNDACFDIFDYLAENWDVEFDMDAITDRTYIMMYIEPGSLEKVNPNNPITKAEMVEYYKLFGDFLDKSLLEWIEELFYFFEGTHFYHTVVPNYEENTTEHVYYKVTPTAPFVGVHSAPQWLPGQENPM
ncbi:hypothetical protein ADUPG1_008305 [Aduncisulcus paluster]|uniref:Uncharacterized protein n=1 Tax=Aduncisulcus paluster TaxID=2918883 RepID=A0ABQ5KRH5_9EUKA|nr:hypothetical protein ADUPG1_008305 [Aduncisulcus paluster]|eukprot:gnl/Carplike_NY0171/2785_a3738_502.p1 GENE.gnl/Carplike_NY0171/2785_a3738_502~~gnl/Carplike_NY0171/2785_a3738_502.p1  ORF type:complete len:322 (+),score=65.76 gnl/Carplike_NY0171/2785_a3738_502:154-1119(+)